jgi:hypothetical protein
MRPFLVSTLGVALFTGLLGSSRMALAQSVPEQKNWGRVSGSFHGAVGYVAQESHLKYDSTNSNAFSRGVGGRLGYTFPFALYLGLAVDHGFGKASDDHLEFLPTPAPGGLYSTANTHLSMTAVTVEVGSETAPDPVIARPFFSIGRTYFQKKYDTTPPQSASEGALLIGFGVSVVVPVKILFLSLGGRLFYSRGPHSGVPIAAVADVGLGVAYP